MGITILLFIIMYFIAISGPRMQLTSTCIIFRTGIVQASHALSIYLASKNYLHTISMLEYQLYINFSRVEHLRIC